MISSLWKALKGRKNTATRKRKNNRKNTRRAQRRNNRKQNGGVMDIAKFGESLYYRPYSASAPDNLAQKFGDIGSGTTYVAHPSAPHLNGFQYMSHGTSGLLNPSAITNINDRFPTLASPPPYQIKN